MSIYRMNGKTKVAELTTQNVDSATSQITLSDGPRVNFFRQGNLCTAILSGQIASKTGTLTYPGVVPDGFRPFTTNSLAVFVDVNGNYGSFGPYTNGDFSILPFSTGNKVSGGIAGIATYPVAN